jgi:methionyl-tRNA synthetase
MLTPVLPELTNKISTFLNEDKFTWDSIDKNLLGHNIRQFKPLLGRIEDKSITQLIKSTE